MSSVILQTAARTLISLLLVVALFALLRGHNEPGGGFIAGLGATSAVVLYALAFGSAAGSDLLRVHPRQLVGLGLVVALTAGTMGLVFGDAFLDGLWKTFEPPGMGEIKVGTPLLFDVGVAMVVLGTGVGILVALLEDD